MLSTSELRCMGLTSYLHNAHVLLFYRWRIWLARQSGRMFAETVLIEWHNEELAKSEPHASAATT